MDAQEIKAELQAQFPDAEIEINVDGDKLGLQVVSDAFEGASRVARQRLIYSVLDARLKSGEIHAVSMRTLTFAERD